MGCFVKFGAISMVIRQKDESQNGGNKKVKHAKFSEKRTFLTPWYAHVQGVMVKKGLKWAINPLSQSRFDWLCLMIINMKMQLFVA